MKSVFIGAERRKKWARPSVAGLQWTITVITFFALTFARYIYACVLTVKNESAGSNFLFVQSVILLFEWPYPKTIYKHLHNEYAFWPSFSMELHTRTRLRLYKYT